MSALFDGVASTANCPFARAFGILGWNRARVHAMKNTSLAEDDCARVDRGRLVLVYSENPLITVDARFLDEVVVDGDRLELTIYDEFSAALKIPQGEALAQELARGLEPFTRSAPISDDETYQHTKAALEACRSRRRHTSNFVVVGEHPVVATDDLLYVGEFVCWIDDVEMYAEAAASLPLPNGWLQAAIAMLVVAHRRRHEDLEELARRVWDYEARTSVR